MFFNQGSAPTNHELDFGIEPARTNALSNFVLVSTNGTLAAHAVAIPTLHQPPSCCDWSVGLPTSKIDRNNNIYIYIFITCSHGLAFFHSLWHVLANDHLIALKRKRLSDDFHRLVILSLPGDQPQQGGGADARWDGGRE